MVDALTSPFGDREKRQLMSSYVINMLFDPAVLAAVENWEQTTSQQQFLSPIMQSLASSLRGGSHPQRG